MRVAKIAAFILAAGALLWLGVTLQPTCVGQCPCPLGTVARAGTCVLD